MTSVQKKVINATMSIFDAIKHLSGETGREVWDYNFHGGIEEGPQNKWGVVMMGSIRLVKIGAPKMIEGQSIYEYAEAHVENFRIDAFLEPSWVGKSFHVRES